MKKRNIIIAIFFGILAIAGAIGGFFYNKNVVESPTIKEYTSEPIQCLYGCPISKKKEKIYKRKYITLSKKRG